MLLILSLIEDDQRRDRLAELYRLAGGLVAAPVIEPDDFRPDEHQEVQQRLARQTFLGKRVFQF